jgi:hypothetical protein
VTTKEYSGIVKSIRNYLRSVRRRRVYGLALERLSYLIIAISSILCAALFLDLVLFLDRMARCALRLVLLLVVSGVVVVFMRSFLMTWRMASVVAFLENRFKVLKGRLFAAMECSPLDAYFSGELVRANARDTKNVVDSLPALPVIGEKQRIARRIAWIPVLLILLLIAMAPVRSLVTLSRIICERTPFPTRFAIYPAGGLVERGYGFDIVLYGIEGRISRPKALLHDRKIPLRKEKEGVFVYTIERVEQPFTYQVAFSDTATGTYFVDVVEHPRIEDIIFTIHFPSYIRENQQQTREFDLYALKGSKITFEGVSSQSLRQASLLFDDSLTVRVDVDSMHFAGSFVVDTTRTFVLRMVSEKGLANAEQPEFRVFSFLDEFPHVELVQPGKDIDLPADLSLDMIIAVSDDYGISRLQVCWEKDGERHTVPVAEGKEGKGGDFAFHWDLVNLPLFPGDTLSYYAEVHDNDRISGPKASRTRSYLIRFPTAEEIYEEVAGGGEKVQEAFKTESGKLDELKEGLKELEQSLRESRNLSWEEKKRAEEIIRKEQELLENIEQAREEMEELAERINEAFLSNPEIREKLEEIERLMKELATEEMKQHMEELREALEKMDRREMLKAMEHMILSQEEIKKRLERTIQILERIAQEERFEKIVEKAEELLEEQKRINREMQDEGGAGLRELSEDEKALEEQLKELSAEMEQLAGDLPQGDSIAKESLESGKEMSSELTEQLKQMQDAMSGDQKQQSSSLGAKSEKKFGEISAILSAGLSSMMSKRRSELEKEFNALINDVIFLSSESEKIMNLLNNSYEADAVLASEDGVKDGTLKAVETLDYLKTKSPYISEIAKEELYRAIRFIEQSTDHIMQGNSQGGFQSAKRAMKSLNLAALELIESKQNMPSTGGSLSQMLQQLQSLASGQMQINQGTQAMIPIDISGGSVPEQVQRELQRLSELQGSLAERLRRIEEGMEAEGGDVLGDLGKVADEMEEVAEKLGQYSLDRELVERQEQILSRMLDAQRSVHRREFSKEREAERPGEVISKSPPPLPTAPGDLKGFRKDILRELEEQYPREYRDLIRAYFDKLLREESR